MGTLDLNTLLNKIIAAAAELTRSEAASILLYDIDEEELYFKASTHLKAPMLDELRVPLDASIAGEIVKTADSIIVHDAQNDKRHHKGTGKSSSFLTKNLLGVPMMIKGQVIGVLEVLNKINKNFSDGDQELLFALGAQAAVAIDNVRLFEKLQRSYESTLLGWAKVLELRDYETKGHTLRVTELALRLAQEMGLEGEELVIMRRGAILHDIGKVAIPDHILRKPGKLSGEERATMNLHPAYAKEMIETIEFLEPSIDIPYCHHEQWDGSGYPRGLKGEEIPLFARIFCIADFWDALTSDRPYRKGVDPEIVKEMIRERNGTHFEPRIVRVFLHMIDPPVGKIML